jgi:hypothetical protein
MVAPLSIVDSVSSSRIMESDMARSYKRDRKGRFAGVSRIRGIKVHSNNITPRILIADQIGVTRRAVLRDTKLSSAGKTKQLRQIRQVQKQARKRFPIVSVNRKR